MAIQIVPYSDEHANAVRDYNERLCGWKVTADFLLPRRPVPAWLPKYNDAPVFNEIYLAIEDGVVRGSYLLKHEQFSFRGELKWVGCCQHPYSEGVVNKEYAMIGPLMYRHASRIQPLLYALGMDGMDKPLPRMLAKLHWQQRLLPFHAKILKPANFLRQLPMLQHGNLARIARLLRITGAGNVGMPVLQYLGSLPGRTAGHAFEVVGRFSGWADEVWHECKDQYHILPLRNSEVLNVLYPADHPRFMRIRIMRGSKVVGWAVVGELCNPSSANFGSLRVGAILDGLARPEHVQHIVNAATRVLEIRGVDLIIGNHSHRAWTAAMWKAGFLRFPSTFVFSVPSATASYMVPFDESLANSLFNRSGADGLYKYEYPFSAVRGEVPEGVTQEVGVRR